MSKRDSNIFLNCFLGLKYTQIKFKLNYLFQNGFIYDKRTLLNIYKCIKKYFKLFITVF